MNEKQICKSCVKGGHVQCLGCQCWCNRVKGEMNGNRR